MTQTDYIRRTGEIEHYFDRTALDAWKRLTGDQPVSGIRATVRKGREDLEAALVEGQAQAVGVLRLVGLAPPAEPPAGPEPADGATGAGDVPSPVPAPPPRPDVPEVDVESLPITGYDSLSASQVVPRLDSLSGDELELVRWYELGNRGRKTILNKIAQLQSV